MLARRSVLLNPLLFAATTDLNGPERAFAVSRRELEEQAAAETSVDRLHWYRNVHSVELLRSTWL